MASQAEVRRADNNIDSTAKNRFKDTKYDVSSHSYPSDLMGSPAYGGNYVIFYINVNVDSKLLKDGGGGKSVITDDKSFTRERGPLLAQNLGGAGVVAAGVSQNAARGGVVGGLAGGAAAGPGLINRSAGAAGGALKGSAVAAAPGAVGLGVAAALAGSTNRQQQRLRTAIALHIPNQLQIRYGMQWSEEDTGTALLLPLAGGAAVKALGNLATGNLAASGQQAKDAAAGVAAFGLSGGVPGTNTGVVSAATGLAFNPRKEQVFKGVDFRSFQFEYQFFPRNSAEARAVLDIIKTFKIHMHPEFKDTNKFLYIYPSEFDISYFTNGTENTAIHKHTSCVLTEMTVNYTPNSQFTTFADGTPTQINIQLSFRELAQLDKDMVAGGM
jgi:hypothetical protein